MKKMFAVVMALMMAIGLCQTALADFYAEVYNTESLNVRSGPGSGYDWLGALKQGEQVRVTGESGNWYLIQTSGGLNGYASKNYLMALQSGDLQENFAVVYNTDSLNIRTGPGTEYSYLGSLARGKWVRVVGESGNWYQVSVIDHDTISEGTTAYMSKNFLQTYEGGFAAGGNTATVVNPAGTRFLNLRAAPSYSADVLGIFYNGAKCTVLERRSDGWCQVSIDVNGATLFGYFRGEYLSGGAGGTALGTAKVNTNLNGGTGGSLNLRNQPSSHGGILKRIPNGATLSVLLKGDPYWMVEYDGNRGFVDSSYISGGSTGGTNGGTTGSTVVRTGNSGKLNLREQANSNAKVLGQYSNGTAVQVLQQGTAWCYVSVNGQTGYMMTKFLSLGSNAASKQVYNSNGGSYVNLRSAPQKSSGNVNVRVPSGAYVNLLSWGEEWSQVSYNGTTGYMMSWFLR